MTAAISNFVQLMHYGYAIDNAGTLSILLFSWHTTMIVQQLVCWDKQGLMINEDAMPEARLKTIVSFYLSTQVMA